MVVADSLVSVSSGVWIWSVFEESVRTDLYSTAIRAEEGLVIVDPVRMCEEGMEQLARNGPVCAVVLTSGNHLRAAPWFRKRFGTTVYAHPDAVAEFVDPVDGLLRASRPVAGDLRVLEIPGAAEGEVALYCESRGHLHFGDALVNLPSTGLALLPEKYCTDAARLRQSLKPLAAFPLQLVTFAHGAPLQGGDAARVGELLAAI